MPLTLELIDPTEASPKQAPKEVRDHLEKLGKRNNLVALRIQRDLHTLGQREDFGDLRDEIRSHLAYFRALAFDGLHPESDDLGRLHDHLHLYGGPIFDATGAMVEGFQEYIEAQKHFWERNQGYEGDTLHAHQDEDTANILAKTEGGTVTLFGSAQRGRRTPEYESARWFTRTIIQGLMQPDGTTERVASGAGPGIMEGANRGAREGLLEIINDLELKLSSRVNRDEVTALIRKIRSEFHSLGVRIQLAKEVGWNPYLEAGLTMAKFSPRKQALIATTCGRSMDDKGDYTPLPHGRHPLLAMWPGGFGTEDEGWEALCLEQCRKMPKVPFFIVDGEFVDALSRLLDLMERRKVIDPEDRKLITLCDNEVEALERYLAYYRLPVTPFIEQEIHTHTPLLPPR
jgi:predicted Rossmann-fold nucleotide-binding protein